MSERDVESESRSFDGRQSGSEFDGGSQHPVLLPGVAIGETLSLPQRKDDSELLWLLVSVQAGWMILVLGVFLATVGWSLEQYFLLSFLGLLGVRLLFAPTERPPLWWSTLNWIVYAGFLVLGYIFLPAIDFPRT